MGALIPIDNNTPPTMADVATFTNVSVVYAANGTPTFLFTANGLARTMPLVDPNVPDLAQRFQNFFNSDPDLQKHGRIDFSNQTSPFIAAQQTAPAAPAPGPSTPAGPTTPAPLLPGAQGASPQAAAAAAAVGGNTNPGAAATAAGTANAGAAAAAATQPASARISIVHEFTTTDVTHYWVGTDGLYLGIQHNNVPTILKKPFANSSGIGTDIAEQEAYVAKYLAGHAAPNDRYQYMLGIPYTEEVSVNTEKDPLKYDKETIPKIARLFEKAKVHSAYLNVDTSVSTNSPVPKNGVFFSPDFQACLTPDPRNPTLVQAQKELFDTTNPNDLSRFEGDLRISDPNLSLADKQSYYALALSKVAGVCDSAQARPSELDKHIDNATNFLLQIITDRDLEKSGSDNIIILSKKANALQKVIDETIKKVVLNAQLQGISVLQGISIDQFYKAAEQAGNKTRNAKALHDDVVYENDATVKARKTILYLYRVKDNISSLESVCSAYKDFINSQERQSFKFLTRKDGTYNLDDPSLRTAAEAIDQGGIRIGDKEVSQENFFFPRYGQLKWRNVIPGVRWFLGQTAEDVAHNAALNMVAYRAIEAGYLVPEQPGSRIYKLNKLAAAAGVDTLSGRNVTPLSEIEANAQTFKDGIKSGKLTKELRPKGQDILTTTKLNSALGQTTDDSSNKKEKGSGWGLLGWGTAALTTITGLTVWGLAEHHKSTSGVAAVPAANANGAAASNETPPGNYVPAPLPGGTVTVPGAPVVAPPVVAPRPVIIAVPGSVNEALQIIENEVRTNGSRAEWFLPDEYDFKLKEAIKKNAGSEDKLPPEELQRVQKLRKDGFISLNSPKNPELQKLFAENKNDWRMRTSLKGKNDRNLADVTPQQSETPKWAQKPAGGETPKWAPKTKLATKPEPNQTKPASIAQAKIDGQNAVHEV